MAGIGCRCGDVAHLLVQKGGYVRRWRSIFSSLSIIFMLFGVGTAMAPTVETIALLRTGAVFELPPEAKLSIESDELGPDELGPDEPCGSCSIPLVTDELTSSMISTTSTTTAPKSAPSASPVVSVATAATVAGPPPAPRPVEEWRSLVSAYFATSDVDKALGVISCESGGDPNAVNPISGAAGLFQHIPRYWPDRAAAIGLPDASIFDPMANVAAAAWLVYTVGWSPWNASAGCW